ncbi:hypothetical protein [Myxosarcina sp. GI1]|uniref:hypothetical protein n=1 Tax=Myxosarcina sp. GI1 TaxID=1541065 RepID=UPI00056651E6|nr:hypothetical protein [Myxosarcina sp. GI1]
MVNPKKAAKLIRQHFAELTTEQFIENLRASGSFGLEDSEPDYSNHGREQSPSIEAVKKTSATKPSEIS